MPYSVNPDFGYLEYRDGGSGDPDVEEFDVDVGANVTPAAGVVTVTGTSVYSDGSVANTLTLNAQATANTFLLGAGAQTTMTEFGPLTNGELIIGSTGVAPVAGSIASADGSITITAGAGTIDLSVAAGDDAILTITGDAGGALSPTAGNINILGGSNGIDTSGAGSTLTLNFDVTEQPTLPNSFPTDAGTAAPALNALTVAGGTGINTAGAGSTVTVNLDSPVLVANGGTGTTTLTDGGILIGSGTGAVTVTAQPTNGQILIGSTGVDPVLATLTESTGIDIVNGAGSISIAVDITEIPTVATSYTTDSGSAVPAAGVLSVLGGTGINTSGATSVVTVNLDVPVIVANGGTGAITLTDGGILLGSGTGAVTVTSQPTNGQLLIGSTGVDPVLGSLASSGSTITITPGAGTINLEVTDGTYVDSFTTDAAGPVTPSVTGVVDVTGTSVFSDGTVANTLTLNVQATAQTFLVGAGAGSTATELGPLTNGQLIMGSTGLAPVLGTLTDPAAGITITEGAGSITFALADDLAAVEGLGTTGIVSRTAADTWTTTSVTDNAIFVGDAGEVPQMVGPLTNGQLLIGSTGATPVAATLASADASVTITNGAGTIDLAVNDLIKTNQHNGIGSYNLGFNVSAGTATIRGSDGENLGASNPAYVTIQSNADNTEQITYELTSNKTFDYSGGAASVLAGSLFSFSTGDTTTVGVPFYMYVAAKNVASGNADTAPVFFVSRYPNYRSLISARLKDAASGSADRADDILATESITVADYQDSACTPVGNFVFNIDGTDDWSIAAQGNYYGFGKWNAYNNFVHELGVMDQATASYFLANGGTAPTDTAGENSYRYIIDAWSNTVSIVLETTFQGTPAGAVDAIINIPLIGASTISTLIKMDGLFYDGGDSGDVHPVSLRQVGGTYLTTGRQFYLYKGNGTPARWQYEEFANGDKFLLTATYRLA